MLCLLLQAKSSGKAKQSWPQFRPQMVFIFKIEMKEKWED